RLDDEVRAFEVADITHSLAENLHEQIRRRGRRQIANTHGLHGLLRACRERPRDRRAAEQCDELAPVQLIELHSVPAANRIARYRIKMDQSVAYSIRLLPRRGQCQPFQKSWGWPDPGSDGSGPSPPRRLSKGGRGRPGPSWQCVLCEQTGSKFGPQSIYPSLLVTGGVEFLETLNDE